MTFSARLTFSSRSSSLSSRSSCCRHHSYSTWTWALNFPASAWFNCAQKKTNNNTQMSDGSYTFLREHRVYAKTERGELTSSSHCRCLSLRAISSGVSPASLAEGRTTQTHYRCREASDARPVFLPTPILFNHGKCVIRPFPTVCCLPVLPLYQSIIWLFC